MQPSHDVGFCSNTPAPLFVFDFGFDVSEVHLLFYLLLDGFSSLKLGSNKSGPTLKGWSFRHSAEGILLIAKLVILVS